ncbi:MAG: sigma-70 family RNA polymerase sigma factor, partial [Anaerolineales bacterium]
MTAIYRYSYYRLGDSAEAEDLTETTFLRVWEGLKRFQPGRVAFRSWLYRVAHNLLIDRYRARKPQGSLDDMEIADSAPAPEASLIAKDESRRLAQAIRGLKPEYQQVLTLRFIAGITHAEAALIIGCSQAAARVLQHRALAALRESLDRSPGEAHDSSQ